MKEYSILENGHTPTITWSKIPLFNLRDSERLLAFCERHGVGVLGIEGFRISEGKRIPDPYYIADFSSLAPSGEKILWEKSIRSAREFLNMITDDDLLLEFVLVINQST